MSFLRRGPSERRGAAALVFTLLVATAVVLIFTGALTRSTSTEADAERARRELALLEQQRDAGAAEVEFLETSAFVQQMARSIGYGERGEIAFQLEPDAPSPRPIIPLGSERLGEGAQAPFEAWMELLFGA